MSGFNIYNASAGSGKTYQLTKNYLTLVLSNISAVSFRQILALTFTNKAVAEMKTRILDSLSDFSNPAKNKKGNALFQDLKAILNLSTKALEKKADIALKILLHNYDFFEIATIDKFTHRVIRTFAKDLKLSQNFEVELDSDRLLDKAIGRLLQRTGKDKKLERVLLHFTLQKIAADKSWNIKKELTDTGKLLFKENHYQALTALSKKDIEAFEVLRDYLVNQKEILATKAKDLAQNALDNIYQQGFEDSDFNRGTLPNHFKQILAGTLSPKLYTNKLQENLTNGKVLKKDAAADGQQLCTTLLAIYLQIKETILQYLLIDNAHTNILPLTLLNEIAKEIQRLQQEDEILHISEFNKLISKEIASQPAPYIYERLGEKYRHYFIDEFQDTSTMQWQNLVPLISNALETETLNGEQGSLMLVGDVKQSIYRWRGGDPKQFLNLNEKEKNPFTVAAHKHSLDTNWRSFENIINFNNEFFSFTASYLKEPKYQALYNTQCQQLTNHRKGGYVEILFAQNKEGLQEHYCQNTLTTIHRILDKGFTYRDICLIIRKKEHSNILANFLAEANIPLISSDSLLLANNAEVVFLIDLLRLMDNPQEGLLAFNVLSYLFKEEPNKHDYISKYLSAPIAYFNTAYDYDIYKERTFPVLQILERAIAALGLREKHGAHLVHLLDLALEIGTKDGVGIHHFLHHWDLKQKSLSITVPEDQNAVQIMTVHKSKGLEFPFVIFPFADSKINAKMHEKKLWVPIDGQEKHDFDKVLVSAKKELQETSGAIQTSYTEESNLSELDDINVLYVALTRAVEGLFIFSLDSKGDNYGALFKAYFEHKKLWSPNGEAIKCGYIRENTSAATTPKAITPIPYIYTALEKGPQIASKTNTLWEEAEEDQRLWGTLVHKIMANIHTKKDLTNALNKAIITGELSTETASEVAQTITAILNHPKLACYYQESTTAKNEIEIMDSNGQLHRPDRLVFNHNKVTIIDYKTGKKNKTYATQLNTYESLLHAIGFIVEHKILIYIGAQIEPVFI